MTSTRSLLLASTALFAVSVLASPALAATPERTLVLAQAVAPPPAKDAAQLAKDKAEADKKKAEQPKSAAPAAAAPATKAEHVKPAQAPVAPAAQKPQSPAAPKNADNHPPAQHPSDDKHQRVESHDRQMPPPPAAAAAPAHPASPAAAKQEEKPAAAATAAKPESKPADKTPAPAAQTKPAATPDAAAQPKSSQTAPAAAPPPAASAQPNAKPAAAAAPTAPPPPTKARDAGEFIRRDGQAPSRGMDEVRKERHETKDGDRTVIHEGDRTIERDGNRSFIRHNEADRFAVGARDVKVDRHGDQTVSIVVRPNGISIVSTTDRDGHLLRRVRRDRSGHDVVIIDNGFAGARRGDFVVDLAPPRDHGPRDRYIVDAGRARPELIYQVFEAAPVQHIERRYTVDQVRYSHPLREYMPRVDLDVNFETGSWQLTPDQVGSLSAIAHGLNRAIEKNPREVFLIEGHTDAVGSNEDNLSLSDRRAEAVAIALTERFQVPPENLVTQGYGEEYPKVATDAASRENRRVAVRRITPLIDQAQTSGAR